MATSEHFSDAELRCPHCGVNKVTPEALVMAEAIRAAAVAKYGEARMVVHSGYRCAAHNKAVGGAPQSQHLQGKALDFEIQVRDAKRPGGWKTLPAVESEPLIRSVPLVKGFGRFANGGAHCDVRKKPAQWCYDAKGKQIPYFSLSGS